MDEKYIQEIYNDLSNRYGANNILAFGDFSKKISSDSTFAKQTYDDFANTYGKDKILGFDDFYTKVKSPKSNLPFVQTAQQTLAEATSGKGEPINNWGELESAIQNTRKASDLYAGAKSFQQSAGVTPSGGYVGVNDAFAQKNQAAAQQQLKATQQAQEQAFAKYQPQFKEVIKPLVDNGYYKKFFDEGGNFKTGDAINYFDKVVKEKGGGGAVRDVLVNLMKQVGEYKKNEPQREKIRKKYESTGQKFTEADVEKEIQAGKDMADKAVDKGLSSVLPLGLFNRSVVSGWYRGLANVGDFLSMKGVDNNLSRYLQSKSYEADVTKPANYEYNKDEWFDRLQTSVGSSLGASAPITIPALAATLGTGGLGAPAIASAAIGGAIGFKGEQIQNTGEVYRQMIEQTGDPAKAYEAARRFEKAQYVTAPLYLLEGLGMQNLIKGGVRKILTGQAQELSQELSTEYFQGYTQERETTGEDKGFAAYVKDNPELAVDVIAGTLGQGGIMASAGKVFQSINSKIPNAQQQLIADMVDKQGAQFAYENIQHQLGIGAITEEEAQQQSAQVDKIASQLTDLKQLGLTGDDAKAFQTVNESYNQIQERASNEQSEGIKIALEAKANALKAEMQQIVQGNGNYAVVTMPGGAEATRIIPATEIQTMRKDGRLDELIQESEKIEVPNDSNLNKYFEERKAALGNPTNVPDGMYGGMKVSEPVQEEPQQIEGDIATEQINTIEDGEGQRGKEGRQDVLNQPTEEIKTEDAVVEEPVSSVEENYFLNSNELADKIAELKIKEKKEIIDAVGEDWYKKYSMATNAEKSKMEDGLTAEQKNIFGGVGKEGVTSEDLKAFRERVIGIETSENVETLGSYARQAVTDISNNRNKNESIGVLNAVAKRADELGVDKKELQQATINDLRGRVGDENAASILNQYFNNEKATQTEKPIQQTMEGSRTSNEALKDVESTYQALQSLDKLDAESVNNLIKMIENDYSVSSLAKEIVSRSNKKFVPASREEIKVVKNAKTPKEVLEIIHSTTTDESLKKVAGVFLDNYSKVEPFLEFKIDLARDRHGYPAGNNVMGSYGGGKIHVSERAFWQKNNLYFDKGLDGGFKTALHEFTHAFTIDAYRKPKTQVERDFKNYIDKTYSELKRNSEFKESYGFKSPEEFIAEVFTNPEFRYSAPIYKSGILDKIIEFIAKIFGYKRDIDLASDTRFKKLEEAFDYILKAIPEIRAGKGQKIFYETNENLRKLSEAYHKAKREGSNPEFVKAVEAAINKTNANGKNKTQAQEPNIKAIEGVGTGNEPISSKESSVAETIIPETTEATGAQPPIPTEPSEGGVVPPSEPPVDISGFELPESDQERVRGAYQHLISSNIDQSVKDRFDEFGITYKVANLAEAHKVGNNIVQAFGAEKALELARFNTFHPSVNSAVFSSVIDYYQEAETNATTQSEKFINAKKWADVYDEYALRLTSSGQFGAYAYQFYKTSPIGFVISAKKRIDARRDYFINKDEKSLKELWDDIKSIPEFQQYFEEKVKDAAQKSKREIKAEKRQKIVEEWDKLKLRKNQVYAVPVPLTIINGAIEVMKQAHLLGFEVVDIIAEGVKYINENHKDGWDEEKFRKDFTPIAENLVKETTKKRASTQTKEKILKKWEKKLSKLSPEKRKELLSRVLNQIVESGGMEYDNFKQMYADALGVPAMTPELQQELKDLGTKLNNVDKARNELSKPNPTQADIDKFLLAVKEGEVAARKINDLLGEKGITLDRILTITKLNTLSIPSLIINPVYNLFYMPIRFLEAVTRMGLDYGLHWSGISKSELKENVFYKQRQYWSKFGEGFVKSIKDIATGEASFDYFQKPTRQNIQPIESAKELYRHFTGDKKLTTSEVANAILEAFPLTGGSAAFIARALQIGDLPFRYAAEGAAAANIATQKGLKGLDKKAFILNPDEESKELIKAAGEKAVMAQENALTKAINTVGVVLNNYTKENRRGRVAYAATKIIGATTQPFIKIPLNSAYTVFQLAVPEFSLAMGIFEASRGHKEAALQNFTKAIVGYSIGYVAAQLAANGLLSGTDDDKEKIGASIYMADYVGNNSINISGTKRWLRGETPDYQQGDITWNTNMMGAMGALMQLYAAQYDKMTPEQWDKEGFMADMLYRTKGGLIDGMKSNVFGNTSTLLAAIDDGNTYSLNKWMRSSLGVLTNTVDPSWLSTFGKLQDGYKADYSAMGTKDQLISMIKERLGKGGELPSQITVWGEKRPDAPKSSNAYLYYYFNIMKSQNVDIRDFGFNIMALYKRTKEDAVIPSRPQKTIRANGMSYQLSPTEYEKFQIIVGKNRMQLTKAVMSNPIYYTLDDTKKVEVLKSAYEQGYSAGLSELIMAMPNIQKELTPKK